jgi:general stress protein YciG
MANNQNNRGGNNQGSNSNRGFASMDDNQQRKIAQKGGEAVSQNREHMSEIGRKGGEASHGGGGNRGGNNR